ncbi:MAG: 4-alpha-glucanotransferase [Limnochordia bacterium]
MSRTRKSGVLLHITSLPSPFGIGDLGPCAYRFVDFLKAAKQKLWQVLPLGPVEPFGSPYAPYSAFAGNPCLISPELLIEDQLLSPSELAEPFISASAHRSNLITLVHSRFQSSRPPSLLAEYHAFCHANRFWLSDYALFMALKGHFAKASWVQWPEDTARRSPRALTYWRRKLARQIQEHKFAQFLFYHQWQKLKAYARRKGIAIIGDLPLFVAHDSADVWSKPYLFQLDKRGMPVFVAGVPPDYFSETGQLWGNPVYDWQMHYQERFLWWRRRIGTLLRLVDLIRLDHFRGFEAYWRIPFGSPTAADGRWMPGPGSDFFAAVKAGVGRLPFIAEDLGFIDAKVVKLRQRWNLPGMRVLQFGFEALKPNLHSPHNYPRGCAAYTGTHDNDTAVGWYRKADPAVQDYTRRYLGTSGADIAWDLIRAVLASPANIAIVPAQDLLSLDSEARMNTPGTIDGNWQWRCPDGALNKELSLRLAELTSLYGRD